MKDLVSVIVPINDVESYVSVCLDSIINQTYSNLEIILVYKKTSDSTLKILKYYEKKDKRISIVTVEDSKKNLKNIGLRHAKGKYITMVDGGDYVNPDYVEYMLNLIKKEKADMVCTGRYNKEQKNIKVNPTVEVFNKKDIMANYMHMKFKSHFYAKLYKKEIFEDIEYPDVIYYDDFITTYKMFVKANKIVASNLAKYCLVVNKIHYKNKIADYDRMKKIGSCFDMLTFIEENYPELSNSCKTKICFEALDLFKDVKDKDYRKQLYSYIKLYRKYAINDERIDMLKKMQCIRSILGYHFMKLSFDLEELLNKPIN